MNSNEELMRKLEEIKRRQDELEKNKAREKEQQPQQQENKQVQQPEIEEQNKNDFSSSQNDTNTQDVPTSSATTTPMPATDETENTQPYDGKNNSRVEEENDTNKNNKWLIAGVAAAVATVVIIAGVLKIYNNNKNKNTDSFTQTETTTSYSTENNIESTSSELENINGYLYKKDDSVVSSYNVDAVTPWLDKLYVNNTDFYDNSEIQNAYADYCRLVNEIEKVDQSVVPGTNKRFEEATYVEVDDAYKYHLREISQIRQIFDLVNGNDDALEIAAGCNYKGTQWNTNNTQYKAQQFKSNEITKRWNSYSKGNYSENDYIAGNKRNSRKSISDLDIEDLEYVMEEVVQNNNERILASYSKQELRILRNMVMAINHYKFKSGDLKDYFESKPWYDGYIEDQSQIHLNDYQRRFVDAIRRYE